MFTYKVYLNDFSFSCWKYSYQFSNFEFLLIACSFMFGILLSFEKISIDHPASCFIPFCCFRASHILSVFQFVDINVF